MILLFFVFAAAAADIPNWPQFRGPNGSGAAAGSIPLHFGPQTNLAWKVEVPGGHSSPVIWGDRLFLTGFANDELLTLCFDRATGKELWRRTAKPTKIERGARSSHPATSTPCTDGVTLCVYFGAFGALAYNFDGRELWRTPLPVPVTQHGASSSPVLAGDFVILQRDADVDAHLLALKKRDGTVGWRVERPDVRRSFSTPLVSPVDQRIIVPGTLRVTAYEAMTGRETWTVRGVPNEMCSSPVAGDGLVFVAGWTPGSGVPVLPAFDALLERGDANKDGRLSQAEAPNGPAKQHFTYNDANKDGFITRDEWQAISEIFSKSENAALAIRPGGKGDVTRTHVAWRQTRGLPYVPTPLWHRHRLYLIRNGGLFSCFNATNGAALFQEERIGAIGDYYASPIAAGERLCVFSQPGVATILAAGDEMKVLAQNTLGEASLATPALVEDTLYVRSANTLWAFRERK
jgi:outer membrane protein assembly factor BamB